MAHTTLAELLPGTLDLLILRTLVRGANHGYGIAQRVKEVGARRRACADLPEETTVSIVTRRGYRSFVASRGGLMPVEPSQALLLLALPVLGFILGAVWMKHRLTTRRIPPPQAVAEATSFETRVQDVLDNVQAQVAELADQQEFMIRVLSERQRADHPLGEGQ